MGKVIRAMERAWDGICWFVGAIIDGVVRAARNNWLWFTVMSVLVLAGLLANSLVIAAGIGRGDSSGVINGISGLFLNLAFAAYTWFIPAQIKRNRQLRGALNVTVTLNDALARQHAENERALYKATLHTADGQAHAVFNTIPKGYDS